jgi:hypothetical protein
VRAVQHEHTEHIAAPADAVYAAISDADLRRIDWGSPSGYYGWMQVAPDGEGSRLTLFLNTRHDSERDHDVAATLDAIRMLVESEI